MKLVKILITAILFTTLSTGAFAQLRLGAGVGFAFDSEAFTIFGRGAYDINDKIRINATYNYYFPEELQTAADINISDINVDLHYTLVRLSTISFYGLAGANFVRSSVKINGDKTSDSDFGLNLGAGGLFGVADNIDIMAEFKYTIGGTEQLFFNAGLLFSFLGGDN